MEHLELHYIVVKDILISSWRNDHKEVVHYKCAIAHMPFYCHTKSNANRRGVRTAYTHHYSTSRQMATFLFRKLNIVKDKV